MRVGPSLAIFLQLSTVCFLQSGEAQTTRNIQDVFIGRCWEYQRVFNPDLFTGREKDCDDLWIKFSQAFANKEPCNTTSEDYREFAEAAVHEIPRDKSLFWRKVYPFVNDYSAKGKRYTTVADTLMGYIVDNIYWCGQPEDPGVNYDACPSCPGRIGKADYVYWQIVSEFYAKATTGVTTLMVNGSRTGIYNPNSIFATHELANLTPENNVTAMKIIVVHNLGGPVVELCGSGTIKDLQATATGQGLHVTCVENPESVRFFQCTDQPEAEECVLASSIPPTNEASRCHGHFYFIVLIYLLKVYVF